MSSSKYMNDIKVKYDRNHRAWLGGLIESAIVFSGDVINADGITESLKQMGNNIPAGKVDVLVNEVKDYLRKLDVLGS